MKGRKLVGAVLIATAALILTVGTGTAAATTICPTNESTCSSPNPAGTKYSATLKSGSELTFASGFSTIKCKVSAIGLEQSNAGGGSGVPVVGRITSLSYGECGTATFTVLSVGSGQLNWTSGVSGSLTGDGTLFEILVGTTRCFYGGQITAGFTVTGGAPATAKETNVGLIRETGSSALCANPAKLNSEYVFGQNAYVAQS